ncbi:MHS family MFS transporter [Citrobacter braakii]|nr:MHS family MFS transporter [Citrobacter braakii]
MEIIIVTDIVYKEGIQPEADTRTIRKVVVAGSVGTIIEWYDYALYGAAAGLVINKLFFPSLSPSSALLAALATFAVGYFARPLGGVIISHIGDKWGRKPALIFSIVLMGLTTVALGLLPSYFHIGVWSSVLLVLLRLLQGFGAGAELAGALTFVGEYVPFKRRAFYTSIINASTVVGIMLATGAFLLVSQLPEDAFLSWGWRIPFLASSVLFILAFYIRHNLDETPAYQKSMAEAEKKKKTQKVPLSELLKNSPKEVFYAFLSVTAHQANSYILSVFSISYMVNTLGMTRTDSLIALICGSIAGIIGTPIMGSISDKVGAPKVYSLGCIFIALFSIPFFAILDTQNLAFVILGMCILYGIGYGATSGSQGAFLVNLFPIRYRFSGVALSRELNGMLIAGPTPFICAWLVTLAEGKPTYVFGYIWACCLLSVVAVHIIKHKANNQ